MTRLTRRNFVQASTAVLVVPTPLIVTGCSSRKAEPTSAPAMATGEAPHNPFLDWFGVDHARIRRVMAELGQRGADDADLYFQHSRDNWITYQDGIVSKASTSIDMGVGMRVVVGQQSGFAYTEDLGEPALLSTARAAAAIAHGGAARPPVRMTPRAMGGLYRIEVPYSDVGIEPKIALIQRAATLAHQADPSITKVRVSWNDTDERVLIVDVRGNIVVDRRPMASLNVSITATKGGKTQNGHHTHNGRHALDWFDEARVARLVREAVERTMALFEADQPPAGEMPVVLAAGASGILLHEAIGHGMEADFNRRSESIYSEMLGKRVASEHVTVVDDGTLPNERGALNFDDEGVPTQRTVLVDRGVLRTYLHDKISANHYKLGASTGSGRRQSFRSLPMPRMRATFMESGPHGPEEIIRSVKRGIFAETFLNGQVRIGQGDFTFYVKNGRLIEDGRLTAPIRDCNIIGNGPEMLKQISMVGQDFKLDEGGWTCGKQGQMVPVSQGMPTVLVSKLTVGGQDA